jgi:pyruvyltransferase
MIKQKESIFKMGINSLKKEGFKETLYKIPKFIKRTGFFYSPNRIRALWFSSEKIPNFGDRLTPYLIEKFTGETPFRVNEYCNKTYYMMSGSILDRSSHNAIIFGSGILKRNEKIVEPKKILAVRGPLTRKRLIELGYNCPEIYGDPALLLPLVHKPKVTERYKIGVIPHYVDYNYVLKQIGNNDDFLVINIFDPIEKVIDNINKCEKTISSSLHGLIVSHAYNKPSLWVKFSGNLAGDDTKFYDYLYSVNIQFYDPLNLKSRIPQPQGIEEVIHKKFNVIKPKGSTIQKMQKNLMDLWPLAVHKNN